MRSGTDTIILENEPDQPNLASHITKQFALVLIILTLPFGRATFLSAALPNYLVEEKTKWLFVINASEEKTPHQTSSSA